MAVTWNPADKDGAITLSGGNLVATKGGTTAWGSGRATASLTTASKWFFSLQMTTVASYAIIGIANSAFSVSGSFLGASGSNSIGYQSSTGGITINGSVVATMPTFGSGDVIDCAIDLVNSKIWFRKNGGNWNNSASANPATNAGGVSLSGLNSGPYYPAFSQYYSDVLSANFGATTFTYAVPSGFSGVDFTVLTANSITTAPSSIGSPAFTQRHVMIPAYIEMIQLSIDIPVLTPVNMLVGVGYITASPNIGFAVFNPWFGVPSVEDIWLQVP